MFSSTILDVAAGVIFGFLAISLFTSAAVEVVNSFFKLRASDLKSGVMALLNDPNFTGLAKKLYQHAAISPLGPGDASKTSGPGTSRFLNYLPTYYKQSLPSYIDKTQFAGALLDVTELSARHAALTADGKTGTQVAASLNEMVGEIGDPQIKQLLQGIISRCAGDLDKIETELADWFDVSMDRVSGGFKRRTQVLTFVVAFAFALLVNVDTIRIGTVLWEQPALADRLKSVALPPAASPKSAEEAIQTGEQAIAMVAAMAQDGVPVGWPPGHIFGVRNGDKWDWFWTAPNGSLAWSFLGWLITATAALFGAPFWFDTLQSVIRLKGSGPSPADKVSGRAAAN